MTNIIYSLELPKILKRKSSLLLFKKVIKTCYLFNKASKKCFSLGIRKNLYSKKSSQTLLKAFDATKTSALRLDSLWVYFYQQLYLSTFFKNFIKFKAINTRNLISQDLLGYITYSIKGIRWKKYYIIHSNEILEMLIISLWLKNLNLFMRWVRKHFEKTNLKNHKKLFLLLKFLLGKFIWYYNIFFELRGIRVILLGKFGKAGSVRKTRKYIRKGKCSYTTKQLALINQTVVIHTITGVFSIKMEVFY